MAPLISIRNGFANGVTPHSHFYAAWNSRHQSSMIPKALKFATLHGLTSEGSWLERNRNIERNWNAAAPRASHGRRRLCKGSSIQ